MYIYILVVLKTLEKLLEMTWGFHWDCPNNVLFLWFFGFQDPLLNKSCLKHGMREWANIACKYKLFSPYEKVHKLVVRGCTLYFFCCTLLDELLKQMVPQMLGLIKETFLRIILSFRYYN